MKGRMRFLETFSYLKVAIYSADTTEIFSNQRDGKGYIHLHTALMDALGPQLVILRPRHEPLADPLVHHEDDLGRDLRAQEPGLLHPGVLPLGEVVRHLEQLDARRRLRVARVLVGRLLLLLLLVVLLELELLVQWLLRLARGSEVGVRGRGRGEEEGVDAGAVV